MAGKVIKITEKRLSRFSDALASKVVEGKISEAVAESAVRGWMRDLLNIRRVK